MKMTFLIGIIALSIASGAVAHDEGHGPKLADTGKYGGLVSPVIAKAEEKKGAKAEVLHKSEMVRTADGTARVYLYDAEMKPLTVSAFDPKASAILASKVKGKMKTTPFTLEVKDGVFIGKMPKPESKPYGIEVTIKKDGKELLTAFENLD